MTDESESTDISSSSIDLSSEDDDGSKRRQKVVQRRRKRYKRSIYYGQAKWQARYYGASCSQDSFIVDNASDSAMSVHSNSNVPPVLSDSSPFSISDSSPSLSETTTSVSETSQDTDQDETTDHSNGQQHYKTTPLFEGSIHTVFSAYALIMLYVMKHSLSRQAFSDLLILIDSFLPNSKFAKSSVYKIKDVLKKCICYKDPKIHCYCQFCQMALEVGQTCNEVVCRQNRAKTVQFLDLHLKDQLTEFFQDDGFLRMVSRQELYTENTEMKDITDGLNYKTVVNVQSQKTEKPSLHLTFTMNTDGVAIFSSSKKGNLWPVYLAINELPVKLRFSRKYIIPCLLHCEVEKPNMITYLSPLMKTMKELYSEGMEVKISSGSVIRVTGQLLTSTLDLPARALVANMKQFNGKSACIMCLDEGECPHGQSLARYYPFKEDNRSRTHQSIVNDAERASTGRGEAVNGIKGSSPLIVLKYIDLPTFFVIDWMHCVLLGVVKSLLSFWIDAKNRNADFFIGHKLSLLNSRLLNIKIPDFISRRQRSLADHSHWKASECREWLIHFSVPVLYGQLNADVFVHYTLLVTAMALLTKDCITRDDIDYAEQLLLDFCRLYPAVYGVTKQTMNVHLLRHVAQFTRLYGPLFSHSAFGFESMNSNVKNMVHGTGHINSQISFAVMMSKSLGLLVKELTSETAPDAIKKTAQCLGSKFILEENSFSSYKLLGKRRQLLETDDAFQLVPRNKRAVAISSGRIMTPNGVYHSKKSQEKKTKNSYTVTFDVGEEKKYGYITSFVEIENEQYAVIRPYRTSRFGFTREFMNSVQCDLLREYGTKPLCPHISKVMGQDEKALVHVTSLGKKCVLVNLQHHGSYISCPPNLLEHG